MATRSKKKTRTKSAKKSAIITRKVPGLKGVGLLQIGKVSKLELRDRLQMNRVMFGRIVNVAERTIAKVESKPEQIEKLTRPYNEIYRLIEALSEVVDPDALGTWFGSPNDAFGGLKPIELIERGEVDRLWEMVYRLRSGLPG